MLPDFNRLKIFHHIHQARSVSGAARMLHLTQSGVSQHLQKLEEELGVRLFTRMPRKLVPTLEGDQLYALMQPFVQGLEQGLQDIQSSRQRPGGLLRVGAPVQFGENALTGMIARFSREYPEVRFLLELGHPTILIPAVREGRLDVAFSDVFPEERHLPVDTTGLYMEPVADEALVMACSKAYYGWRMGLRPDLKRLKTLEFIDYHLNAPAVRGWFRHHYNVSVPRLKVLLAVESVQSVLHAIRNNLGMGVVPAHLVREEIESGTIKVIQTRKKELLNRIALVQLENKIPRITEKVFIRFFKQSWAHDSVTPVLPTRR